MEQLLRDFVTIATHPWTVAVVAWMALIGTWRQVNCICDVCSKSIKESRRKEAQIWEWMRTGRHQ